MRRLIWLAVSRDQRLAWDELGLSLASENVCKMFAVAVVKTSAKNCNLHLSMDHNCRLLYWSEQREDQTRFELHFTRLHQLEYDTDYIMTMIKLLFQGRGNYHTKSWHLPTKLDTDWWSFIIYFQKKFQLWLVATRTPLQRCQLVLITTQSLLYFGLCRYSFNNQLYFDNEI